MGFFDIFGLFESVGSLNMLGPCKPVESFDMVGPFRLVG